MIYILFKIYFEAFYWEISLLSLGFSWSPCVGPEGVLCEVSSNRWSQQVKGQLFIDLNTRYLFNLMLFLVLDGENLAFSQLFWVLKISAKTTISLKISSKLTAKSFFDCSLDAIFTSWMANSASVLLSLDFFPRWVDRLLVVFQFQWIQMHKNLRLRLLWSTNSTVLELIFILGIIWVSTVSWFGLKFLVKLEGPKNLKKQHFPEKIPHFGMLSSFPCMNLCRKQLCHIEAYIIGVQAPQVLFSYSLCSGRYSGFS